MMAFLLRGVPVTHLDNNKILALNMQDDNARLPPAPDQDTRSLACWSVLACCRPRGTLVEIDKSKIVLKLHKSGVSTEIDQSLIQLG